MEYKDINNKILKIRTEIQEKYPELVKYLEEMPDTLPVKGESKIDVEELKNYFDSLKELVTSFKNKYKKS